MPRRLVRASRPALVVAASGLLVLSAGLAAGQTPPSPPAQGAGAAASAPWYEQLAFNGMVSASYVGNFNQPASGTNQFRVFDAASGTFTLDVAELDVQRAAVKPRDVGFRVDLTVGSSIPKVTAASGLFRDENGVAGDFDVHQAFLSYIAPAGRGLRFDAGKFTTHIGYEVIEGYEGVNDNHSHSFLFGYAQPVTHTGLRVSYPFADAVSAQMLLVNGWDNAVDNNTAPSVGAQLALAPSPRLSVTISYLGGPEQADTNAHVRHAFDVVAIGKVGSAVTLVANYDYGREGQVSIAETAGGGVGDTSWQGVAGYARYTFSGRFACTVRGEWFDDPQGARTGYAQALTEVTLTPEFRPHPKFVVRGDLRRDRSSQAVFERSDGTLGAGQTTLSVNALVLF
jgi:hypothetical protein